ncbi:hypothetical protein VNO78_12289 [Psophocarpus tetragonolobus]|uniref:PPC domain-containing protein n=1 Tax=Psophocarpus tetragonolobus TaxID=3891 RepID=A0AAN9SQH8_PSOTE
MVDPGTNIIPISSSSCPFNDNIVMAKKKKIGRPLGSKNKIKPPPMTIQVNEEISKPIFIEISDNSDVIKALVQFARHHQVNVTVLNASGTISSATLHDTHSHASAFTLYGPFTLISFIGTYTNKTDFCSSSSSLSSPPFNVDPYCFRISFCSNSCQSFNGVVGGKVMANNGVIVAATIGKKLKFYKNVINNNRKEQDNGNNYDQDSNKNNMISFNVATSYSDVTQ